MTKQINPIRIGDTFTRSYRVYNPKPREQWANPRVPEADTDSPFIFTGYAVTFNIVIKGTLRTFTTSTGVTISSGLIKIDLTSAQTALFTEDHEASSYIVRTAPDGKKQSIYHFRERILRAQDVIG